MANLSGKHFTNDFPVYTTEGEALNAPLPKKTLVITIIINSITCPFTILFIVLVIMAVTNRPRLQSNANILLACLAATDVLTGLVVQPSFVLSKIFHLLGVEDNMNTFLFLANFHNCSIRAVSVCSCLHLMLVTCERLIAIKFTMHYPYFVIKRNIKVAVISIWIFAISLEVSKLTVNKLRNEFTFIFNLLVALVLGLCVLFITFSYLVLYRETRHHEKMIKTQQLPQEAVERFVKESKVLKTTAMVVGAVMLCFVPMTFILVLFFSGLNLRFGMTRASCTPCSWIRTFAMLNSFVNPLIYCWRQKEMRQFVFRLSSPAVAPT